MKTTELITNVPLRAFNVHKWRGAVIEKVLQHKPKFDHAGIPTDLFHNHNESQWNNNEISKERIKMSRYPMIQYRSSKGKAVITGIGPGAEALKVFCTLPCDSISIDGENYAYGTTDLRNRNWSVENENTLYTYRIKQWIPFNPEKHKKWKETTGLTDRSKLADRALFGHFFHLIEDLGIQVNRNKLVLNVSAIHNEQYVHCFRIKKFALDVEIVTNYSLPDGIGIGQGTTLGFGQIKRLSK